MLPMFVVKATIATHVGHQVAREHNRRNRKVTDKEEHIRKDGDCASWLDVDPRIAYERLFGKAIERYNEKQKREERKIKDYYIHVAKEGKKHPVYEMIVGVYPQEGEISKEEQKQILYEFAKDWNKNNPNLYMIGCYWHADEAGEPHIHIDYIPWSDGYKKGLERQSGLVRALEAQGYKKHGRETAVMQWTRAENDRLEAICKKHGIEVLHPLRGKHSRHISTEEYKYHKAKLEEMKIKLEAKTNELEKKDIELASYNHKIGEAKEKVRAAEEKMVKAVNEVERIEGTDNIFQWMEDHLNKNGKSMFQIYCQSNNLDYEYWVAATGIYPNPNGQYREPEYDDRELE